MIIAPIGVFQRSRQNGNPSNQLFCTGKQGRTRTRKLSAGCTNRKRGATIGEGETRGALGCASDSVNDVHVDVMSKALNVNCRSPGKFMNVSCELFLTKRVFLPQHDDRSEHQDHEGSEFQSCRWRDWVSFFFQRLHYRRCSTGAHGACCRRHRLEGRFLVWE